MAKKTSKKDSVMEQVVWVRPCDIKVVRTSEPKVMLDKFLAENVCRAWTEDFVDEDTGKVVSVSRKEVLFEKGTLLSKSIISEILFYIQTEDIKDVAVTETNFNVMRYISNSLLPWEVNVASDDGRGGTAKSLYLVRAQSAESAITVATEYAGMYLRLHGWVTVKQAKCCDYRVIEDDDKCIPQDAPNDPDSDYDYFKVIVQSRFFSDLDDDVEKTNHTYIIKSQDVGQAKERIADYCRERWSNILSGNPRNIFVVLKAMPYETSGVVPLSYCELYKEKQEYK